VTPSLPIEIQMLRAAEATVKYFAPQYVAIARRFQCMSLMPIGMQYVKTRITTPAVVDPCPAKGLGRV
jgi:hypothetical protein